MQATAVLLKGSARLSRAMSSHTPQNSPTAVVPAKVRRKGAALHAGRRVGGLQRSGQPLRAELLAADLSAASLCGAELTGADLGGAQLMGVNLEGANLRLASLEGAQLQGANLRWSQLVGADLTGADLAGADLTGAVADATTRWPAGFDHQAAGLWMLQVRQS